MNLSIVTSLYRSAGYLPEFYRRMTAAALAVTHDYEIILVNDGSPDDSLASARALQQNDARLKVIDLSRNFGHHRALMTGLAYARGERVFMLDADLEEAPELLGLFSDTFNANSADVVFGVQARHKGGVAERLSSALFYRLFNLLSDTKLPLNMLHARLMSRRFVDALMRFRERELFILGLCQLAGFLQIPVVVEKFGRKETSYSLARRLRLFLTAMTSFTARPFFWMTMMGAMLSLAFFVAFLVSGTVPPALLALLLSGVIFCVGLLGMYVWTLLLEVKQRPYVIVREIYPNVEPVHPELVRAS